MSANVIFHRLAHREYCAARDHYERRSTKAAARFANAIARAVQQIADDPNRWPEYRPHYLWVLARRFPYLLVYRSARQDPTCRSTWRPLSKPPMT